MRVSTVSRMTHSCVTRVSTVAPMTHNLPYDRRYKLIVYQLSDNRGFGFIVLPGRGGGGGGGRLGGGGGMGGVGGG